MKDICFVIPYFGRFNNYFQLFLHSCSKNRSCDWLIFTDDKREFDYPVNVKVIYTNFQDIVDMFQHKFDFPISLKRPYKLCDYKPAYGYLFEEYLEDYRMWGYCDTDLIWGDIARFITKEMIDQYDKIGIFGHCTLFKNSLDVNRAFMMQYDGKERYKQVYSEEWNHSFDEEFNHSINNIFINAGLSIYYDLPLANIYTKSSDFRLTSLIEQKRYIIEKKKKAFFLWNNGKLNRYVLDNDEIIQHEYLYIHMQSRRMDVHVNYPCEQIKIIPNAFDKLEIADIDCDTFKKIRIKYFNLHYFKLRSKNLLTKIKKRLYNRRG